MNAHRRMKTYMERHKIGQLFEDLMGKLMSEMPSDPVSFLVKQLQQKLYEVRPQTVMTLAQLRRSVGDLTVPLEVEKAQVHRKPLGSIVSKRRPATASMSSAASASRKTVTLFGPGEVQPVSQNMDRRKSLQLPIQQSNASDSNIDFHQQTISKSVKSEGTTHDAFPQHQQTMTCEHSNSRSVLPGQILDDPLRDEFVRIKVPLNIEKIHPEVYFNKHNTKQVFRTPNDAKDTRQFIYDKPESDMEMYENPEDLAREGIFVCKASNLKELYKFSQPHRRNIGDNFHFTICSVCAKIAKSDEPPMDAVPNSDNHKEKSTGNLSDRFDQSQIKIDRHSKLRAGLDRSPLPSNGRGQKNTQKYQNNDLPFIRYAQDSGRSLSTENLFAETPRSLPLPATPPSINDDEFDWSFPSVEFLQACSSGWTMIERDHRTDSERQ